MKQIKDISESRHKLQNMTAITSTGGSNFVNSATGASVLFRFTKRYSGGEGGRRGDGHENRGYPYDRPSGTTPPCLQSKNIFTISLMFYELQISHKVCTAMCSYPNEHDWRTTSMVNIGGVSRVYFMANKLRSSRTHDFRAKTIW